MSMHKRQADYKHGESSLSQELEVYLETKFSDWRISMSVMKELEFDENLMVSLTDLLINTKSRFAHQDYCVVAIFLY